VEVLRELAATVGDLSVARGVVHINEGEGNAAMTAAEEHTQFEKTGPRTLAGRYLRRFWHPIFVSKELVASRAMPIRLLGDDFVLYRGEQGGAHLLDARCAHRKALLAIGRVEADCLRCRYHGWKYAADGQCVEQPAERKSFAHKVKLGSYPVREYLGLVWAYVGEAPAPPAPTWPQLDKASIQFRFATSEFRPYNFFADLENVLDDSHLGHVHARSVYHDREVRGHAPNLAAVETEYGLLHETTFEGGRRKQYMLLMPNCVYFRSNASNVRGFDGLLWIVPVDDVSHRIFFALTAVDKVAPTTLLRIVVDRVVRRLLERITRGPTVPNEQEALAVISGRKRFDDLRPEGMLEDHVVLAAQGVMPDRSLQWLGTSDVAIILLRKLWAREMSALAEGRPLTPFAFPPELRPQ
jgi:5,5'-dehydrodivanillate O-demethylase oxygenase subunit